MILIVSFSFILCSCCDCPLFSSFSVDQDEDILKRVCWNYFLYLYLYYSEIVEIEFTLIYLRPFLSRLILSTHLK